MTAWAFEEPATPRSTVSDWVRAPGRVVMALIAVTPVLLLASWAVGWATFGLIVVAALWVRIGADAVLAPQAAASWRIDPRRAQDG